ncbi:MAG: HNH endonuclease family protein [Corynebacterium sp.]|uniref:HNH endonuclease family protein n=1 Tax=Corynebacterium sp. TaxID=1720 RepID=UPI0026DD403F|nr:HNH endonuclease family protein [Corynebacterium sp.]MDO4760505.1 HNH endonuclease family protein [Corynebacterium sp.]
MKKSVILSAWPAVLIGALVLASCQYSHLPIEDRPFSNNHGADIQPPPPLPDTPEAPPVGTDPAFADLESLTVRDFDPEAPRYDRALFGQRWSDDVTVGGGHNGCDTRNDILARDLEEVRYKPGTRDCVVISGHFTDPYTGQHHTFQRGQGTSDLVPIDHVVALGDAWYAGAWTWDENKRRDFANDPINLQTTLREANNSKLAQTAATWLPPNNSYHCEYARRQVEIKKVYGLAITNAEKNALATALSTCAPPTQVQ